MASRSYAIQDLDASASLKIGHRGNPSDTPGSVDTRLFDLNGRVDNVQVYVGYALAPAEIAALYAAGLSGETRPVFHRVEVHSGDVIEDRDFGNFVPGAIRGDKFEDLDGDGMRDGGEPGLPGWTINLDRNGDGSIEATTTTVADGSYAFPNLSPGTYVVSEVVQGGSGSTTVIPLDPRSTYLRALYNEPMMDSVPLELSSLGIQPGDTIHLARRGDFDQGDGWGDTRPWLVGVFSSSSVLWDPSQPRRVPGALEAGTDWNTWGLPNDIPEDFFIDDVLVEVPAGATHLFLGVPDSLFSDNRDPDGDFAVEITGGQRRLAAECPRGRKLQRDAAEWRGGQRSGFRQLPARIDPGPGVRRRERQRPERRWRTGSRRQDDPAGQGRRRDERRDGQHGRSRALSIRTAGAGHIPRVRGSAGWLAAQRSGQPWHLHDRAAQR